jgi:hypothetical protein
MMAETGCSGRLQRDRSQINLPYTLRLLPRHEVRASRPPLVAERRAIRKVSRSREVDGKRNREI